MSGSELELHWDIREGSASNRIFDKGEVELNIKPGFMEKVCITFDIPKFNTFIFITLQVVKNSITRFSDNLTCFEVTGGEDFRPEFNCQ